MSLVLEYGCHTWVVTPLAVGPVLAIDGHRLQDHPCGAAGAAAAAGTDADAAEPQQPSPDTLTPVHTPADVAAGGVADPTITTCAWALPGTSGGLFELVRIGPLALTIPDAEPQAWAQ